MNNIIIADPHSLCREALCHFINKSGKDFFVSGVGDFEGLRARLATDGAQLILIDSDLPGLTKEGLAEMTPDTAFGFLVSPDQKWDSLLSVEEIKGIFPKNLSSKDFIGGIELILAGQSFFPEKKAADDHSPITRKSKKDFQLTMREKEVLSHLARGSSNKEIARFLDLQVVTIKLHVRGICRKLGASNRTQAALIAMENGQV